MLRSPGSEVSWPRGLSGRLLRIATLRKIEENSVIAHILGCLAAMASCPLTICPTPRYDLGVEIVRLL